MILNQIIEDRKIAVKELKEMMSIEALEKQIEESEVAHYSFKRALQKIDQPIQIIAEVKKASPSKGVICKTFPYLEIAKAYEEGKAAAISVLTESKYFKGANKYLTNIKETVKLPVLRKDFIIDPIQIYEARAIGADALLLIGAILSRKELQEYLKLTSSLGMDALVETHNEREIEMALEVGAEIIGVNNRNLNTFEVNLEVAERLRELVPKDKVFIAESGIQTEEDVRRLKKIGVDALLIGESVIRSQQPVQKLQQLIWA